MFAPGVLMLYGILPFWGNLRTNQAYRRALPGLMAAAVGLVVMAVFHMYGSFTCAPALLVIDVRSTALVIASCSQ